MEKLEFTERSWHAILWKSTWGDCLPENICGYFWSLIIAIIIFPLAIIGHILNIMTKGDVKAAWWALYPIICFAIGALVVESTSEPHKYTYQISLHEKCIAILQTKLKAIERLDNARGALAEYKAAKDRYAPIRLYNTEDSLQTQIDWYEKVVARISSYYRKQSLQLCRVMLDVENYDQKVQGITKPSYLLGGNVQIYDVAKYMSHFNTSAELMAHPITYGMAELTSHLIEPTNVPYDTATN